MDELEDLLAIVRRPVKQSSTADERFRAMEDRATIHELVMRYGYLCDGRAWDELVEFYTDDIERVVVGREVLRAVGRSSVREQYRILDGTPAPPTSSAGPHGASSLRLRHIIGDEVIRIADAGDRAWVAARGELVASVEDPAGFMRGAHDVSWAFELRREDEAWKIARLVVYTDSQHNPMFGVGE